MDTRIVTCRRYTGMCYQPATGRKYGEQNGLSVLESRAWVGYLHLRERKKQEIEGECIITIFKICTLN